MAKPGMIGTDGTARVFMAFVRVTGPTVDVGEVTELITVCRGHDEFSAFFGKHAVPGLGTTFFDLSDLMHRLATSLSKTRPPKTRPSGALTLK